MWLRAGTHVRQRLAPDVNRLGRAAGRQRQLRSTYEIDDQSNDENGSKNAAAEIHELLRLPDLNPDFNTR
jgi:hypothetical protein